MRFEAMDPAVMKLVYASLGGAGVPCTWIASANEVAGQLLGVPLPVVLGAGTGALLARAYAPSTDAEGKPVGFMRALGASFGWTLAGSIAAPLVHALVPLIPGMSAATLPAGALAGIAGLVASLPAWGPKAWPFIRSRLPGGAS